MGNLYESKMDYHGNILVRTNGERQTERLILWGGKERGRDRKPNLVACSARIVSGWVEVA